MGIFIYKDVDVSYIMAKISAADKAADKGEIMSLEEIDRLTYWANMYEALDA